LLVSRSPIRKRLTGGSFDSSRVYAGVLVSAAAVLAAGASAGFWQPASAAAMERDSNKVFGVFTGYDSGQCGGNNGSYAWGRAANLASGQCGELKARSAGRSASSR
jgi:hypothetical protein